MRKDDANFRRWERHEIGVKSNGSHDGRDAMSSCVRPLPCVNVEQRYGTSAHARENRVDDTIHDDDDDDDNVERRARRAGTH